MSKAALRRIDVEAVVDAAPEQRTSPILVGANDSAPAARSTPRELQQRLSYEFGGQAQAYPEPVVEKFSPGVSMLILLGGLGMLWAALAVGFNLAVR